MDGGERHRENISVAFYHNDASSKTGTGLVGMVKSKMMYWHTEVAFPISMYGSSGGSRSDTPASNRLFAYGVFSDHIDVVHNAALVHKGTRDIVFSVSDKRGRQINAVTIVASRGWKDITEKEFPSAATGDIAMRDFNGRQRLVEVFEASGRVNVEWMHQSKSSNRFSKSNQAKAKITISHVKHILKLELSGIVFGKQRDFSNPAYTWIHLNVPVENAMESAKFADNQVGKPHDANGIYWAMVWPRTLDYKKYYCVNLVAAILQRAGLLQGTNPCYILPDDLYRLLEHHPDRITAANPHITAQAMSKIGPVRTFSPARREPSVVALPRVGGRGRPLAKIPARNRGGRPTR